MADADVQNIMVKNVHNQAMLSLRDVPKSKTVGELKEQIAEDERFPPAPDQAILLDGRDLANDVEVRVIPPVMSMLWIVNRGAAQRQRAGQRDANRAEAGEGEGAGEAPADAPADAGAAAPPDAAAAAAPAGAGADAAPGNGGEQVPAAEGAAPARDGPVPPIPAADAARSLQLFFQMFGNSVSMEVPLHATFGHIKTSFLSEPLDIPPRSIRLIYVGAELDDHSTPFQEGCVGGSRVHIVRNIDVSLLPQVISKQDLIGNCHICETQGTTFVFRPQCAECHEETISDPSLTIEVGTTTWGSLAGQTCLCYNCAPEPEQNQFPVPVPKPLGFAVLCDNRHMEDVEPCPTRQNVQVRGEHWHRRHLADIDSGNIVESANLLYGYAHANGYVM